MIPQRFSLAGALLLFLSVCPAAGQPLGAQDRPVQELSIEELLNVEVTSVARKTQRLSESAAAVYVLTRADIRRSGAMTVPDVLRLVPGVQVARIDSNKWAVSVRGFNSRFANKLLVLIDGRSAYSPLYSGVYWETIDLPLDEIDRIEVIRGPGGTMWGANAVNGVINIITTRAQESQGTTVAASLDSDGPGGSATVRRGWKVGETGGVRVYAKGFDRDSSAGPAPHDEWDIARAGFRLDTGGPAREWSLQATVFNGLLGQTYGEQASMPDLAGPTPDDARVDGIQVSTVWRRTLSPSSNVAFRAFYDRGHRAERLVSERRDTADVELQHQVSPHGAHDVVWGGGYRTSVDEVQGAAQAQFLPAGVTMHLFNAFVQDDWRLTKQLHLSAGAKLERTTFAGLRFQPSARALWNVDAGHAVWVSASRAVRTPSRAEVGLQVAVQSLPPSAAVPLPSLTVIEGASDVEAESLWAYEAGYRARVGSAVSVDVSAFVNRYTGTIQSVLGVPSIAMGEAGPYLKVPLVGRNVGRRGSRGAEAAIEWHPMSRVRVSGAYTRLDVDAPQPDDLYGLLTTGRDPAHQVVVRTQIDLPHGFEIDPTVRAVSALQDGSAAGYQALDFHVGRRFSRALDLAVVGRNLLSGRHVEFQPTVVNTLPSAVRATVGMTATWRF